jgi:hypothetical protein
MSRVYKSGSAVATSSRRPGASLGYTLERTAAVIEHPRLRWSVTDPTDALGGLTHDRRVQASSAAIRDEIRRMAEELRAATVSRRRSLTAYEWAVSPLGSIISSTSRTSARRPTAGHAGFSSAASVILPVA